jgi:hypothetical protein
MLQNKNYSKKKYQWAGKTNINDGIYYPYPGIRVPAVKPNNSKESINVLPIQDGLPHVDLPEFEIKDKRVIKNENKPVYNNDGSINILSLTNPNMIKNHNSTENYNDGKYWLNKVESRRSLDEQFNYNPNKPVEVNQVKPIVINDLKEYEKRKRAYEDSLQLHLQSKRSYDYINMAALEHSKEDAYHKALGKTKTTNSGSITPYDIAMAATQKAIQEYDNYNKFMKSDKFKTNWIKNTTGVALGAPTIGDGIKNKDGVIFRPSMPYDMIESSKTTGKDIEIESNKGAIFPPPKQKVEYSSKPSKATLSIVQPIQTPITTFQPKKETIDTTTVAPKRNRYYTTPNSKNKHMSEKEEKRISDEMYKQMIEDRKKKQYGGDIKYKLYSKFNK